MKHSSKRSALLRLYSLCKKETLQIVRDPSTLLIAFVFPVVLMCVFGMGINLDSSLVELGVVAEDDSPAARRLVQSFAHNPSFRVREGQTLEQMANSLRAGKIQGFVVIRSDFSRRSLDSRLSTPSVQIITDGAEPNNANFVAAYAQGVIGTYQREEFARRGQLLPHGLTLETRSWFNPSTVSRNFLLPGSITIIMTVVGALLTALVIAREWERGTMEALLAAGVSRFELVLSKLLPYFVLGMLAFAICVTMTHHLFHVPLRGSIGVLLGVGSAFLCSALGMGLLLSTTLRNQYNAAQAALNVAFLPALMLSGFVFEIASMPLPIRLVTSIIPARYFVTGMQTLFQAGDVASVIARSLLGLTLASLGFIGLTLIKTRRRLQ
jgi:ABC-2 type transport system permease protein